MKVEHFIEVTDPVDNLRRLVSVFDISFIEECPGDYGKHRTSLCIGGTFEYNDDSEIPSGTIFIPCAESYEEILDKMIEASWEEV